MTNNVIIKLAREAGLGTSLTHRGGEPRVWIEGADWHDELTRFALLARTAALEEAARVTGEFAQKWWSIHCASNKHMETTRKAHDDFCALQAAIRAMKEQA